MRPRTKRTAHPDRITEMFFSANISKRISQSCVPEQNGLVFGKEMMGHSIEAGPEQNGQPIMRPRTKESAHPNRIAEMFFPLIFRKEMMGRSGTLIFIEDAR
jgi:hypothetical protein